MSGESMRAFWQELSSWVVINFARLLPFADQPSGGDGTGCRVEQQPTLSLRRRAFSEADGVAVDATIAPIFLPSAAWQHRDEHG